MSATKKTTKVSVKLLDDTHQHAGENCEAGDVINLRKAQADSLIKRNKAEITQGEASDTTQSE